MKLVQKWNEFRKFRTVVMKFLIVICISAISRLYLGYISAIFLFSKLRLDQSVSVRVRAACVRLSMSVAPEV